MQTGANPAALLRGSQMTLADGALLLWPNLDKKISVRMLETLSTGTGIPLDLPFDQLAARHRRLLMHGTGDTWFEVHATRKPAHRAPLFRFQFKGLYPALDEAARLSPGLRGRLNHLIDEVECSACGGSRLRTMPPPCVFADFRWMNLAGCRWASCNAPSAGGSCRPETVRLPVKSCERSSRE